MTSKNTISSGTARQGGATRRPRRGDYDLALLGSENFARAPIQIVLSRLKVHSRSGDGWSAHCPAHPDNRPSLSIGVAKDGKVLLTCHAGCEFEDIVEKLDLEPADLFPKPDAVAMERTAISTATSKLSISRPQEHLVKSGRLLNGQLVTAPGAAKDWQSLVRKFRTQSAEKSRDELAQRLGVRREDLEALNVGWAEEWGGVYTFPEHDGLGRIVGIATRGLDDSKRMFKGSKRGLYLPKNWHLCLGPIFIAEGPSDAAAMACMKLAGIGRPSAKGGVDHLCELLRAVSDSRIIFVLGELDAKPDGSWPGRDAAKSVAAQLASKLDRDVRWALPPGGAKDVRAWLQAAGGPGK